MRPAGARVMRRSTKLRIGALPLPHRPAGKAHMDALTPASLVHYYDTNTHGILCGVRGADHRSTKHSRGVTCHACVGLLGKRPDTLAPSAGASFESAAAP